MIDRPTSLVVHGLHRPMVNLALFALAREANPNLVWMELRLVGEPPHPGDPVGLGWVPESQRVTIDRLDAMRPNEVFAGPAFSDLILDRPPDDTIDRLLDFLTLPEASQQLIASRPVGSAPGLVAVADAHRLISSYPSALLGPVLAAHRAAGYSLFVGYTEVPCPAFDAFDYRVVIEGDRLEDWPRARVVCEHGDERGTLRTGASYRLSELPFLERTFRLAAAAAV